MKPRARTLHHPASLSNCHKQLSRCLQIDLATQESEARARQHDLDRIQTYRKRLWINPDSVL